MRSRPRLGFLLLATGLLDAACQAEVEPVAEPTPRSLRVAFLGDSLTAGWRVARGEDYPSRVAKLLEGRGLRVEVRNHGISGDTTGGGLGRLEAALAEAPDLLVVALGANDGLRRFPLAGIEENLRRIVERAREGGVRVGLAGMRMPPDFPAEYREGYAAIFPRLAEELGIPLLPFLLEGVAARPELNFPDGLHPNPDGYAVVADRMAAFLAPLLAP